MILYHGSTLAIEKPQILRTEIGRDFGFAFYTTDITEQAIRWANRKAMIASRTTGQKKLPAVSAYEWNEQACLNVKRFDDADMQWLELVLQCRSNVLFSHDYDIVIGKIADDNVGETVSYVLQGIMRKEDAVSRLKFEQINNQIAFCSEKALQCLEYRGTL